MIERKAGFSGKKSGRSEKNLPGLEMESHNQRSNQLRQMAAHCKVCDESKQCKLEQTADYPVNLIFSDDGFYNPDACFSALFDIASAAGRSQVSDIIYVVDADQSHPEVVSGLCHVDGINVIDGELLVRNAAVAVTAAVAAKRPWVCSKKITPVAAASPPVFRIAALQFVFSAPADPADFPQFPVFRLNPVHIFAGSNDRREAFECPPWIFSGMRCGTDFNIHGLSGAYHFPERS